MSQFDISDEQLNSLLDGELDDSEREQMLAEMKDNPLLKARYQDLQRLKSLTRRAYRDVPQPSYQMSLPHNIKRWYSAVAASLVLGLGLSIGWYAGSSSSPNIGAQFQPISQIDQSLRNQEKILIHIGSNDELRVKQALHITESLLQRSNEEHRALQLEVVANADGLAILRKNSPYAQQIASISRAHDNVSFLACGIAKKTAALKERKPIELIPEARDIPAALEEILQRIREGWTYVQG